MADAHLLAQALSLIALLGATIEYCEIIKRRDQRRREAAARLEQETSGLIGLVRVMVKD